MRCWVQVLTKMRKGHICRQKNKMKMYHLFTLVSKRFLIPSVNRIPAKQAKYCLQDMKIRYLNKFYTHLNSVLNNCWFYAIN